MVELCAQFSLFVLLLVFGGIGGSSFSVLNHFSRKHREGFFRKNRCVQLIGYSHMVNLHSGHLHLDTRT